MDLQYQPQIFVADMERYNDGSYNQDGWLTLPMTDEEFDKKIKELVPGEEMIILDNDNFPFSISEWASPRDLNEFVRDNQLAIEQFNQVIHGNDASDLTAPDFDGQVKKMLAVADTLGMVPSEEGGPEIVDYSFLQDLAASRVGKTVDVAENLYNELDDLLGSVDDTNDYYRINGYGKSEPATQIEYLDWLAYDQDPDTWTEQHPDQEVRGQIFTTDDIEMTATGIILSDLDIDLSKESEREFAENAYDFNNPAHLYHELDDILGTVVQNSEFYVLNNNAAEPATRDDLLVLQSAIQNKFQDLYAEQRNFENSMNISQNKHQNFSI